MQKTFLGLDLSLTSTGWSVGEKRGAISVKSKGTQRLIDITEQIAQIIMSNSVDCAIVEGYAFAARSGQAFSIGELGGVVRVALCSKNVPFVEVAPTARAKFATGKGNSSKNEVISAISAKTGIVWAGSGGDDMCDAWILEEIARVRYGQARYEWPSISIAVANGIDWSQLENYKGRCSDSEYPD